MAIFIALGTYTDQGFREIKQTVSRTEDFKLLARQYKMTVKDVFWMRGQQYDMVTILEGPDCATAQALLLVINMRGNIRTQLLRAHTASEIEAFLGASTAAPVEALGLISDKSLASVDPSGRRYG
jgi:uncharacterized protein with GYD domain